MSLSRRIGSLIPIWDLTPIVAALTVVGVDFGLINLLMVYPEGWFARPRWLSFIVGDAFFLPLIAFGLATRLRQTPIPKHSWFASRTWHLTVLAGGFVVSIGLELIALVTHQVVLAQELTPSKLAHTLIFAVYFYLGFSVLPFLHKSRAPKWSAVICVVGILGLTLCYVVDGVYTSNRYGSENLLPAFDWRTGRLEPHE